MKNIFENLRLPNNTNGMTQIQINEIGQILPENDEISILEFGAGNTTIKLYEALKAKYKKIKYVTYENNPRWAPNHEGIEVRLFTETELINGNINIPPNEKYDIVIVDGPDGELRKHWYSIFKENTKSGTVIHVDDAFHYKSFETELNKVFSSLEYIFEAGREKRIGTNKCWITVKIK